MRRSLPVFVLLTALLGCTTPPPKPRPYNEQELHAQIKADNRNPWPHYGLAKLSLRRKQYEEAVRYFGRAINLLPPRKATRPMLELGILHHRMNNLEPAMRCYDEVLETIPYEAREVFADNVDYKYAAVGVKVILEAEGGHDERLADLKARFLQEFGGNAEQWDRGATWITPLGQPAVELPEQKVPGEKVPGEKAPAEKAPE